MHQCSRKQFYGYDEKIEPSLGLIESTVAPIIRSILTNHKFPKLYEAKHIFLAVFVVVQRLRALRSSDMNDSMTDALAKLHLEGSSFMKDEMDKIVISNKFPAALPLSNASLVIPHALKLGIHLFVNDTAREFVVCDEPVAAHNLFCEGVDYRGVTGWNCSGLQLWFPLSPRVGLLFYDQQIYTVGKTRKESVTELSRITDIERLNELQLLNAVNNVYFHNKDHSNYILNFIEMAEDSIKSNRIKIIRTKSIDDNEEDSELVHFFEQLMPVQLRLDTLRVRRRMRPIALEDRVRMLRGGSKKDIETQDATHKPSGDYVRYGLIED
jgi:hypothetical protein